MGGYSEDMDKNEPLKSPDWDPTPRWLRNMFRAVVFLFGLAMLFAAWPIFTLKSGIRCMYQGICETPSIFGPHAFGTLWPMIGIGLSLNYIAWRKDGRPSNDRKIQKP